MVPWWNCVIRLAFNPNKLGCITFSINPVSVSLLFTKLEVYGSAPVRLCYLFSFVVCKLLEFVLSPNFVSGWFSFTIPAIGSASLASLCKLMVKININPTDEKK